MAIISGPIENEVELRIMSAHHTLNEIPEGFVTPDGWTSQVIDSNTLLNTPQPQAVRGKNAIRYYNLETDQLFFKLEDREFSQEENMQILLEQMLASQEETTAVQVALTDLYEKILTLGAEVN